MSVWKSDEKLLSICILNFSFKNDFVWEEISNIRHSVSSPDETPRSSSKILRCASYFQLSSRCFIWWWNTASHVWYITSKIRIDAEVRRILMNCKNFHQKELKTKHDWRDMKPCANGRNIFGQQLPRGRCVRFHNLLPVVACCCVLLGVVAQILKPGKLLRQQLATFLFSLVAQAGSAIACEQALLFGQAKRASRERASEGLRRSLARSRETRFTRPNRRAC